MMTKVKSSDKIHYFLNGAGASPVLPFLPIISKKLNFTAATFGLVSSAAPLFTSATVSLIRHYSSFGTIAILAFIACQSLSQFSISLIPSIQTPKAIFDCVEDSAQLRLCSDRIDFGYFEDFYVGRQDDNIYCIIACDLPDYRFLPIKVSLNVTTSQFVDGNCISFVVNWFAFGGKGKMENCTSRFARECKFACGEILSGWDKPSKVEVSADKYQFWTLALASSTAKASTELTMMADEQITNNMNKAVADRNLFRCLGYGAAAIASSILLDQFSSQIENLPFYLSLVMFIVDAAIQVISKGKREKDKKTEEGEMQGKVGQGTRKIDEQEKKEEREEKVQVKDSTGKLEEDEQSIKIAEYENEISRKEQNGSESKGKDILFIISCIVNGIYNSIILNFLLWHLDELQVPGEMMSNTIQGLIIAIQTFVGDLPSIYISGIIVKRLGHSLTVSVVFMVYALRFLGYSFMTQSWHAIPLEFLCILSNSLFQNLISSGKRKEELYYYNNMGLSFGSAFGGFAVGEFGCSDSFRSFGYAGVVYSVVHLPIAYLFSKKRQKPLEQAQAQDDTSSLTTMKLEEKEP